MKNVLICAAFCFAIISPACIAADKIEFLNSGKVLPTTLPFSEAVRVGNLLGARVELECIASTNAS